jgi:hypothetical protein
VTEWSRKAKTQTDVERLEPTECKTIRGGQIGYSLKSILPTEKSLSGTKSAQFERFLHDMTSFPA